MELINRILPEHKIKRRLLVAVLVGAIAGLLSLWGIQGIGEYGIGLFIFTPLFIGGASTILYGYRRDIKDYEGLWVSLITLAFFYAGLLIFAIEGIICIAMVLPLALVLTIMGSLIGSFFLNRKPRSGPTVMLFLLLSVPFVSFVEAGREHPLQSVVTTIDIDADPQTVWNSVIEFPELKEPEEFIFRTGIAYPLNATIEGNGVGAVRYCNFTTGSFVEPITTWDEARLLQFDVEEQPAPMIERGFWDIQPPHLNDYFISKKGQFRLIPLEGGKTRLEGTTWYYHKIRPAAYWKIWSSYIIHQIHNRVLEHIKINSELNK